MVDIDTYKKHYLVIDPNDLELGANLEPYRKFIARMVSNIWWWNKDCDERGNEVIIKAYTFGTKCITTGVTIPHEITFLKRATIEDFPDVESVVDYVKTLFEQILMLPIPTYFFNIDIENDKGAVFWASHPQDNTDYTTTYAVLSSMPSYQFIDTVVKI